MNFFFQERAVFRYSLNNNTPIKNIYQLSPGTYIILTIKGKKIKSISKKYFELKSNRFLTIKNLSEKDVSKHLENLIKESVHSQMNADVPLGIFLSGGIDSTIITSIVSKFSEKQVDTFSFADDNSFIDLKYSKKVAEHLNTNHHEIIIDFDNIIDHIPKMVLSSEGIFKTSFSSFFLSEKASKFVKVILSGEGSDELFGGYSVYLDLNAYSNFIMQRANNFDYNINIKNALKIISSKDLEEFLIFSQNDQLINRHLLPLDHDGMSFGVEVRVPYLDEDLVEFVNSLPWTMKIKNKKIRKYILKITAKRIIEKPLRKIINREKVGMPSASSNLWRNFENLSNNLISDNHFSKHPLKKYFSRKADVLWYDLFNHMFIENNCKVDRNFNIFNMY